jgi:hypothetical protein
MEESIRIAQETLEFTKYTFYVNLFFGIITIITVILIYLRQKKDAKISEKYRNYQENYRHKKEIMPVIVCTSSSIIGINNIKLHFAVLNGNASNFRIEQLKKSELYIISIFDPQNVYLKNEIFRVNINFRQVEEVNMKIGYEFRFFYNDVENTSYLVNVKGISNKIIISEPSEIKNNIK